MIHRLGERIGSLKAETEESRVSFGELRQERVTLSKQRDERKVTIEQQLNKCKELQLLKLGRVIDLDDLEAQSDRSREKEAEKLLLEQQETYAQVTIRLEKEAAALQEQLAHVCLSPHISSTSPFFFSSTPAHPLLPFRHVLFTQSMGQNTDLLLQVAELTERKLLISRELNAPGQISTMSADDSAKEREEAQRVTAYVQLQAREIEALRSELSMLKRKTAAPILLQQQPPMPPTQESILPPIPSTRKRA
jgi:hypothetical protein